jgi:tRNA pseudouridine55 synthase
MSHTGCHDGVLVVNKPRGWTSFDVVEWARGRLDCGKVGHAGTLDPDATGLLILLIGQATKLSQYLMLDEKEYAATIRLGVATDTDDATGRILSEGPPPTLSKDELEECLSAFRGTILQVPPAVSALKQGGRRWYRLAREGIPFERPAREVTIQTLELLSHEGPYLRLRVVCSRGTYIRALARDIGEALGCGGCLHELVRTRAGPFGLEQAMEVEEGAPSEGVVRRVIPLEELLDSWPRAMISEQADVRLRHGAPISSGDLRSISRPLVEGDHVRLFSPGGRLVSIARAVPRPDSFSGEGEERSPSLEIRPLRLLVDPRECA